MKFVALIAAATVALAVGGAQTLNPGEGRIQMTATLIEQQGSVRTYALFNRPAYPNRIGTASVRCDAAGRGWLDCSELIRLSRGTIITRGLVPAAAAYRVLAVVGGTGYYANVGGEMTVQPVGAGQLIIVTLIAF